MIWRVRGKPVKCLGQSVRWKMLWSMIWREGCVNVMGGSGRGTGEGVTERGKEADETSGDVS